MADLMFDSSSKNYLLSKSVSYGKKCKMDNPFNLKSNNKFIGNPKHYN